MIVDAHQHFLFPSRVAYPWLTGHALEPLRRDFAPGDLEPELLRNGVSQTVLVQTHSSLIETREFLRIAAQTPFVAGVVGWVDLSAPDVAATLEALLNEADGRWLVGVRHQVQDEADPRWLLRDDVRRGLEVLGARGLAFDLLVSERELSAALEVARAQPELRFVIDHAANPNIKAGNFEPWRAALEPLASCENVFVKLSGLTTRADWRSWTPADIAPYLTTCFELFGVERCLWGSDWPVCLLAGSYAQTLELLRVALSAHSPEASLAVLGGNAKRVYHLPEWVGSPQRQPMR